MIASMQIAQSPTDYSAAVGRGVEEVDDNRRFWQLGTVKCRIQFVSCQSIREEEGWSKCILHHDDASLEYDPQG